MSNPYCDICGVVDDQHNKMYCNIINKELRASVAIQFKMQSKILKLEAALERIRDCEWVITLPDRMDAVRAIARKALE